MKTNQPAVLCIYIGKLEEHISQEPHLQANLICISAQQYSQLLQQQQQLQEKTHKLECLNRSLQQAVNELREDRKRQVDQLRGAHSQATKYKKSAADLRQVSSPTVTVKSAVSTTGGNRAHTPFFMASTRFLKHACILSNQKASLAMELAYTILTREAPSKELGCEVSPTSLSRWNILLGEVDRINLADVLSSASSDICLFADDSNKGHDERHIVGVHVWSDSIESPVGYILANTVIASTKGKDQAAADHHILTTIYNIKAVGGVVGDNASTQSGAKKGHAVELSRMMNSPTFFIGCYPHIMNIALRSAIGDGFGARGGMSEFNLHQLHYKVAYVHHQHPSMYKALYVSESITSTPPPLPQEFVETRWSYIYEHLAWWWKYGDCCVQLGKAVLESLPKAHSHYTIWREIVEMAASPFLAAERCLLWEVLHDLIIPALADCQAQDDELHFSSGYLSRSWPSRVLDDIRKARFMLEYPQLQLTHTIQAAAFLDPEGQKVFLGEIVPAFTSATLSALQKHATRWLQAPLLICMGASTTHRIFFWRAWLLVMGHANLVTQQSTDIASEHADIMREIALEGDVNEVEAAAVDMVLTTSAEILCGSPDAAWLDEFIILAYLAKQRDELCVWKDRWAMGDRDFLGDIAKIANSSHVCSPDSEQEPHLWSWCCKHIFPLPVSNTIAERQFNIASIYLSPTESEESKQSSHLFVENVLHNSMTATHGERVTAETRHQLREQMSQYCATVTPELLRKAQANLTSRKGSGTAAGRTLTATEVHHDALQRHTKRPGHEQDMIELQESGKIHGVHYLPTRKADAPLAEKRSFPSTETPAAKRPQTEAPDEQHARQLENSSAMLSD